MPTQNRSVRVMLDLWICNRDVEIYITLAIYSTLANNIQFENSSPDSFVICVFNARSSIALKTRSIVNKLQGFQNFVSSSDFNIV